ncbi:chalcone isomerase family protein [Candidatus Pelagisphaera phototrophica]|uniref:chalcone isomerase family protein n=1 Tax=Candidatus Pelagisphaera phototrophica TaxID=2684113 RepID=UPI0019D9DDBB|nr:chalcone isomerase family protein [Candidatus Pelagisphaera phototrophica]
MNAAYRDVRRGGRYTLRYDPGKGTSLLLNGDVLQEVPSEDFHRIYSSILLGPESPFRLETSVLVVGFLDTSIARIWKGEV